MTANKFYTPAFIGGRITAVQMVINNPTESEITASDLNGVYYSYQGHDMQLLSATGRTISAGDTIVITEQLYNVAVPTSDIKLMVDTAGLVGCVVNVQIFWSVE